MDKLYTCTAPLPTHCPAIPGCTFLSVVKRLFVRRQFIPDLGQFLPGAPPPFHRGVGTRGARVSFGPPQNFGNANELYSLLYSYIKKYPQIDLKMHQIISNLSKFSLGAVPPEPQ